MRMTGIFAVAAWLWLMQFGFAAETNFANDAFASQLSMDAYTKSIRHRMQVARMEFYGTVDAPPAQRYADARLDDCGDRAVTVWADGYASWGKKKDTSGYKYTVGGPALGIDWSNGPFTFGIASTYNWGKLKGREIAHDNKTRTWAVTTYAQWNYDRFYVNADLTYGRNRFKSTRDEVLGAITDDPGRAKYHTNAWNAEMEIGTRLNACNFLIEPHIGVRYFHDKRNRINERFVAADTVSYSKRNYHTLEMPLGVDIGYEISVFNTLLLPRFHFAWVPQLDRKYARADMATPTYERERSKRGRHGFELGAGFQTKIFRTVAAHVDYNVNMRSKAYEHILTAGLGISF